MWNDIVKFVNSINTEDVQVSPSSNKKVTATVTEDAVIAIDVKDIKRKRTSIDDIDDVDISHFAWVNANAEKRRWK